MEAGSVCPEARAWLAAAVQQGASDLHLVVGSPPTLRLHDALVPLEEQPLGHETVFRALKSLCSAEDFARFLATKNLDFAFQLEFFGCLRRFRANYFFSGESVGACLRVIPHEIPTFQWAGFPRELAERLVDTRDGLILVCGVTGSGKTTTLAMLIHLLAQRGGYRIITIEEPIEYLFASGGTSIITQREVGRDVDSFADGLKYGLRQDPDVFLVGEIRDRETGQLVLSAAETGHLVLSTLHSRDAKGAISRFADLFPQAVQSEIRAQLALGLRAVVCQHLLPSVQRGAKRELALEVLFNNSAVAAAIRSGRIEQVDNHIQTGKAEGMITLNESVKRLWRDGRISWQTAIKYMSDAAQLKSS
jgi:twitching motility protein PilT